jgi:type IV pilus assembly protein PilV
MSASHHQRSAARFQCIPSASAGFSLLEVLVSLLVLSIGLLGLAGLQVNAVAFNHSAYMRTQATNLAYEIADRMRANRQAALDDDYDGGFAVMPPACGSAVAGATVAEQDVSAWRIAMSCTLPGGNGSVDLDGDRLTVVVRWDEARGGGDVNDLEEFAMVTGL